MAAMVGKYRNGYSSHTLITCIEKLFERNLKELNYYLLRRWDDYGKYFHCFGLVEFSDCPECAATSENPQPHRGDAMLRGYEVAANTTITVIKESSRIWNEHRELI